MRLRTLWLLPALLLVLLLIIALLYLINPSDIPSNNLHMRLGGVASFKVSSESMAPTLTTGDVIIVSAWPYQRGTPQRGDLVAFRPPHLDTTFVMRVVGLPGERIALRDGLALIDGRRLAEPYVAPIRWPDLQRGLNMAERLVPAGNYFVLGDKRNNANDSRYWGPLPHANLIGRVEQTIRPPTEP